jgi:glycosyltransferase involved in cell wall biosynthesis
VFSFVIPAYNEAALIVATVRSVQAAGLAAGLDHEVIVVDDASDDGTGELAAALGVQVVRVDLRNIGAVRNAGARVAAGNTLIFVDADTIISADVVRAVVRARQSGAIGGGAMVKMDEPIPWWARIYARVVLWLLRRGRLAAGCFLFAARDHFEAVGGFDERLFASEEIALSRALKRRGKFVVLPEFVQTSGRKVRTYSGAEIFRMSARLAFRPGLLKRRSALDIWYGPRRIDRREGQ